MAINPDKCIKVTGRFHSTQGTVGDPALTNIVSGADEVYDDVAPYRTNGHIDCTTVTPVGTENPVELRWYERVNYGTEQEPLYDWIRSQDITVDNQKTYGIPTGAKQSDINNQLYEMTGDTVKVVLYANEYEQIANPPAGANPQANGWYELSGSTYVLTTDTTVVSGKTYYARVAHISPDENKIVNQQDGYIPTAGAVGRAMGANFEDNLQSTSTVKGLTANMGRVLNENKADINGYYETMSVGSAKNLDGENTNSEAYLIRPTGGENNEVVSGLASVVGMEGNSAVWNQLVKNGDFSDGINNWYSIALSTSVDNGILTLTREVSLTASQFRQSIGGGHKYYISFSVKANIDSGTLRLRYGFDANNISNISNSWTQFSMISTNDNNKSFFLYYSQSVSNESISIMNCYIIDLTLLGIDNLTNPADVEAWLAEHVGTKPYYAYNPGTILSANTLGFKTYSRNLLNPEDGLAKLIPYTHTTNSNKYTVKGIPTGVAVTYTPDNTGVAVDVTSAITDNTFDIPSYGSGTLYIPNATANTYVCMKYDGSMDGDEFIVPYKENTYNFDVTKVYGKTGGSDEYVQCFPNGMRSAGSVYDILTANEAIRRVGAVNLGNLTWNNNYKGQGNTYYLTVCDNSGIPIKSSTLNILCPKYRTLSYDSVWRYNTGISITGNKIIVYDPSYNTNGSYEAFTAAMSGVELNYELVTPITYTDLIYREGGIDRPLREVLVNLNVDNWSMEEQLMTDYDVQGNPTSVPATIQTRYSIDAVEAIKTLEEASYFESDIHDNLQAMLTCINTNCASVLGGQFSISETATNKLFNFTFTANASTNSTEENTETI